MEGGKKKLETNNSIFNLEVSYFHSRAPNLVSLILNFLEKVGGKLNLRIGFLPVIKRALKKASFFLRNTKNIPETKGSAGLWHFKEPKGLGFRQSKVKGINGSQFLGIPGAGTT